MTSPPNAHITVGPDRQHHPGSVVTVHLAYGVDGLALQLPIRNPGRDLAGAVNDTLEQIGWQIADLPDRPIVDEDGRLWFTAREEQL